ncbi:hypothetical protein ACFYZ2_31685 [Streptomyces sviceus]|uniref:hypothetical protein n=1 Tax=Streptomyces sviceus TaxID=285530 RepID=UPI00369C7757
MERHAGFLARLESEDADKPITECRTGDMHAAIESIRWFAEVADKVFGRVAPVGRPCLQNCSLCPSADPGSSFTSPQRRGDRTPDAGFFRPSAMTPGRSCPALRAQAAEAPPVVPDRTPRPRRY